MNDISIDVNEITGPMVLKRDELLRQAAEADVSAEKARAGAKDAAERALNRGETAAEGFETEAATKRAYAARWDVIIAREQTEAGVTVTPIDTLVDGAGVTGEVAQP
jgi:hypothetical protein